MKTPTYKGKELLPLSVIDAARDGDSQAVDQVLRYYEGYINKFCTRTLYDPDGQPHVRVDEYMKRRLEIKLIHSIVSMEATIEWLGFSTPARAPLLFDSGAWGQTPGICGGYVGRAVFLPTYLKVASW